MTSGQLQLFDYAARFVTTEDVAAFAPDDPGYRNYVREFSRILESHELPHKCHFDITETIGLTRWHDPNREKNPARFRRFRVFSNSIALACGVAGIVLEDVLPANYAAISLIDDAYTLDDLELVRLLVVAFEEYFQAIISGDSGESPFLLLGLLLAKSQLGSAEHGLAEIADRIIDEESKYSGHATSEFLWGCTFFNQLHSRWKWFAGKFIVPSTPSLALLRGELLRGQH